MQTARGLERDTSAIGKVALLEQLQRVKWHLWHGNLTGEEQTISALVDDIDGAREADQREGRAASLVLKKLSRGLDEFGTYVQNNASSIVNCGERYRQGERICRLPKFLSIRTKVMSMPV